MISNMIEQNIAWWTFIEESSVDVIGHQGKDTTRPRFSDPDRSLNRKRERFKVFEVEPRSNRGRTVMT